MQRQAAVNNSTFENECDIGKAVTDWTALLRNSIKLQILTSHIVLLDYCYTSKPIIQ